MQSTNTDDYQSTIMSEPTDEQSEEQSDAEPTSQDGNGRDSAWYDRTLKGELTRLYDDKCLTAADYVRSIEVSDAIRAQRGLSDQYLGDLSGILTTMQEAAARSHQECEVGGIIALVNQYRQYLEENTSDLDLGASLSDIPDTHTQNEQAKDKAEGEKSSSGSLDPCDSCKELATQCHGPSIHERCLPCKKEKKWCTRTDSVPGVLSTGITVWDKASMTATVYASQREVTRSTGVPRTQIADSIRTKRSRPHKGRDLVYTLYQRDGKTVAID
jgi:hypothetical protein